MTEGPSLVGATLVLSVYTPTAENYLKSLVSVHIDDCHIRDPYTGLLWLKNADAGLGMTWHDAMSNLSGMKLCGLTGWRLPTIEELITFASEGQVTGLPEGCGGSNCFIFGYSKDLRPGLTARGFIGVTTNSYWSSTTVADDTHCTNTTNGNCAWPLNMSFGRSGDFYYKSFSFDVWPVRAGQ